MTSITSRTHFENYAKQIPWQDILEPEGFESEKLDKLRGSEEHAIGWSYDDGELSIHLQTFGEDEPALIVDWNHVGNPRLTKLEAIKKFRCGDNWAYTKALITESVNIGENTIDKVGRKRWDDYQQSSLEMSPEVRYIGDPLFQGMVDQDVGEMIAKDYAKSKFEEMKFAQEGESVKAISLAELLATAIPKSKWLVDGLLMKAGKIFFAAQAKVGKTTLTLALLKSLTDGIPFLGKFKVEVPEGRIGYMNLELTDGQMQEWVARQNIENVDKVHFWNLRGKPNPFRSSVSRNHLIQEIRELGVKTLIIDTFAKIFPGEANNNSEVNRFLIMLDDVLDRAGVEQLVMLVHAGNDASKIRGATALTDHPDGIWYLINDDQKNRYFSAIGRDIEIPEGQILFDKTTSQLSFTGAGKRETRDLSSRERILEFIKANPGSNAAVIDDTIGGTKAFKIKVRKQLVKDGLVTVNKGPNNASQYFSA
jgi:hypothetical protein